MSELRNEVVRSARSRKGMPFKHHFKPIDLCDGGRCTVDECMERGMSANGYDCSGLAIASICDVLSVSVNEWPRKLRHTQQLAMFASDEDFSQGDLRLFYATNNRIHLGIATDAEKVIHASGLTGLIEESIVTASGGSFEAVRVITAEKLLRTLASRAIDDLLNYR